MQSDDPVLDRILNDGRNADIKEFVDWLTKRAQESGLDPIEGAELFLIMGTIKIDPPQGWHCLQVSYGKSRQEAIRGLCRKLHPELLSTLMKDLLMKTDRYEKELDTIDKKVLGWIKDDSITHLTTIERVQMPGGPTVYLCPHCHQNITLDHKAREIEQKRTFASKPIPKYPKVSMEEVEC
jgi:hypothetical protein